MDLKNWQTTLFGGLAFLTPAVNALLPTIPKPWDTVLAAILGALAFYYAKDKRVTGGTVAQ